jgi:meiotic recombination protein REC8, fungi type
MNDPNFTADLRLPSPPKFDTGVSATQITTKTSSQMSPFPTSCPSAQNSLASLGGDFQMELDFHHSHSSGLGGASQLGLQGLSPSRKHGLMDDDDLMIFPGDDKEDLFGNAGNWALEVDEDGNVIEIVEPVIFDDEPQLPPMPPAVSPRPALAGPRKDYVERVDEEQIPNTEQLSDRQDSRALPSSLEPVQQAPARRKRRRRVIAADEMTQLSRNTIRAWQTEYLMLCGGQKRRLVNAARARDNAMQLIFGLGLCAIGQSLGLPNMDHPLAAGFSGDALFMAITGRDRPDDVRGRRRSASEALGSDKDDREERHVKPRTDNVEGIEQQHGAARDSVLGFGKQVSDTPEVGRQAHDALSDHPSSTMSRPWNRGSVAKQGSSVHNRGSARQQGRHIHSSSPLNPRGDLPDITRYSDDLAMNTSDDFDLGAPPLSDALPAGLLAIGLGGVDTDKQASQQPHNEKSQRSDVEGDNFLSFVDDAIRENGERREVRDWQERRKWIRFDDLFVAQETSKATAAQAFYHALSATTRGQMLVSQDGAAANVPFGRLWLGLRDR